MNPLTLAIAVVILAAVPLTVWMAAKTDHSHRRWWGVCAGLLLLGLTCFAAFAAIGSHVDDNGILREPFVLVPTGFTLLLAGVAGVLLRLGLSLWSRRRGEPRA